MRSSGIGPQVRFLAGEERFASAPSGGRIGSSGSFGSTGDEFTSSVQAKQRFASHGLLTFMGEDGLDGREKARKCCEKHAVERRVEATTGDVRRAFHRL